MGKSNAFFTLSLNFDLNQGSTLALLYAQIHPEAVGSLVLRGIFAGRKIEFDWSFGPSGLAMLYPDAFARLVAHIPANELSGAPEDLPAAYRKRLLSDDAEVRRTAGKIWNEHELLISKVNVPASDLEKANDEDWSLSHAIMESHYFINNLFIEEGQLLSKESIGKMRHIPGNNILVWNSSSSATDLFSGTIVQGRLDIVCPPKTAYDLHMAWPESKLHMIPGAGHSVKVK